MSLFSFFKKKADLTSPLELKVDIHSHLIPGIDDGIQNEQAGLAILKEMEEMGYEKVITTPHTMWGSYDNTKETIMSGLEKMQKASLAHGLSIKMEAATEYYLDEHFMKQLLSGDELMTFGDNYVLVETGFINEPPELKEASFQLSMKGYQMVYAHPERYLYLQENKKLLEELIDRDIVFQLNAISLTGCYSKPVQKFAEKLIDMGAIKMIGSDCHHMKHIDLLKECQSNKYWNKLMKTDLLNNSL